jgi:4-hydroxy-3-methylbut-2-en-1-yl diphosphate synthase IspG/GcpE
MRIAVMGCIVNGHGEAADAPKVQCKKLFTCPLHYTCFIAAKQGKIELNIALQSAPLQTKFHPIRV